MPITITTDPEYPVAGEEVTITVVGAAGTEAGLEVTAVPSESAVVLGALTTEMSEEAKAEAGASMGQLAIVSPFAPVVDNVTGNPEFLPTLGVLNNTITCDKAGPYAIDVYDYRHVAGVPSYEGDPNGDTRVELAAVASVTLDVGDYTYLDIVTQGGSGGQLRFQVNDNTIRAADIVNTTGEPARLAALQATVVAAVAALVGQTVTAVGTDLQTGVNDLRATYEAHRIKVAGPPDIHLVADVTNAVGRTDATSNDGAIELLNEIYYAMVGHLKDANDAAAPWHIDDDLQNVPVTNPAETVAQATVLSADLRERCYEQHRLMDGDPSEVDCHDNDDAVNVLTAPSLLDSAIIAYLDELVENTPATPAQEPKGLIDIRQKYGFRP